MFQRLIISGNTLLLFCVCFCLVLRTSQVCEESPHGYTAVRLTCNGIRSFPTTNKSVAEFSCVDCNIPVLNEDTIIQKFVSEKFTLSGGHLQIIGANAFDKFTSNMKKFVFENNEISSVAPKVFSNFSGLKEITFRNSKIPQLDPEVFDATNVTVLDLSRNQLSNISLIFNGLKVTRLNLSSNQIKEIESNAFDKIIFTRGSGYAEIQHLDLSHNFIKRIHPNTFKCYTENNCVNILRLDKNAITTIEDNTFSQLSFVQVLSLSGNSISQLYSNSFNGLISLKSLNLRNNRIQNLPVSLFGDLKSLNTLDLSENNIISLQSNTFSGLTTLLQLNISHNNLQELKTSLLLPLGLLKTLDISDTKLHDFEVKPVLEHLFQLQTLVLNDNFWICYHLVEMYKEINPKIRGFSYPSQHFNVPNLHGIACSSEQLKSYDNLKFDDFLNIISQDGLLVNWFKEEDDKLIDDTSSSFDYVRSIYGMFIFVIVVIVILFVLFSINQILSCVHNYGYHVQPIVLM